MPLTRRSNPRTNKLCNSCLQEPTSGLPFLASLQQLMTPRHRKLTGNHPFSDGAQKDRELGLAIARPTVAEVQHQEGRPANVACGSLNVRQTWSSSISILHQQSSSTTYARPGGAGGVFVRTSEQSDRSRARLDPIQLEA